MTSVTRQSNGWMPTSWQRLKSSTTSRRKLRVFATRSSPSSTPVQAVVCLVVCQAVCPVACLIWVAVPVEQSPPEPDLPLRRSIKWKCITQPPTSYLRFLLSLICPNVLYQISLVAEQQRLQGVVEAEVHATVDE